MRTSCFLVLLLLPATGPSARAQVINGETPYDETMLPRQATGDHRAASPAPDDRAADRPREIVPDRDIRPDASPRD